MWWKRSKDTDDPVERICPVCGKHKFSDVFERCPVCNWQNEYVQEKNPTWRNGANEMSLEEARKAYIEGKEIY